jgi:hypothetical protein
LRAGLTVIRAAAEELDDLAAGFAVEQVARRGRLGHFLQAVRAMRLHELGPEKNSMPARRPERVIQVHLGPGVVAHLAFGAFEPTEEKIEVRMWAPWDSASALRLTLHERDLHGVRPDTSRDGRCGSGAPRPSPDRPMDQTQQTH